MSDMTSERAIDYLLFKTKFHDGNKQVVELIKALTAENAKLREACEAADEFLTVFREAVKHLDQKYYEQTMQTLRTALAKEQP